MVWTPSGLGEDTRRMAEHITAHDIRTREACIGAALRAERYWVTAEDTGGRFATVEYVAPVGFAGDAPHDDDGHETTLLVLDGELTLTIGSAVTVARPGAVVDMPRGVPHLLVNRGARPARFVEVITPAA